MGPDAWNVTHNKWHATCAQFADATLGFLREQVTRNWAVLCDSVTDVLWQYPNGRNSSFRQRSLAL
jgi:hypothetical protein